MGYATDTLSWGKTFVVEGLNPGAHTVQMKYKSLGGTNTIFDRHLSVIGL